MPRCSITLRFRLGRWRWICECGNRSTVSFFTRDKAERLGELHIVARKANARVKLRMAEAAMKDLAAAATNTQATLEELVTALEPNKKEGAVLEIQPDNRWSRTGNCWGFEDGMVDGFVIHALTCELLGQSWMSSSSCVDYQRWQGQHPDWVRHDR